MSGPYTVTWNGDLWTVKGPEVDSRTYYVRSSADEEARRLNAAYAARRAGGGDRIAALEKALERAADCLKACADNIERAFPTPEFGDGSVVLIRQWEAEARALLSDKFDEWIRILDEDVIQGEFGYEPGEFTVYTSHWRELYDQGLTPHAAWQRALDGYANTRRDEEGRQIGNHARIVTEAVAREAMARQAARLALLTPQTDKEQT